MNNTIDDVIDCTKNVNIAPCTYIQKEDFINMIQSLNFTYIENADIKFITAFKFDANEDKVYPKGFEIKIDWGD